MQLQFSTSPFGDPRLPALFWAKVHIAANGCWLWTAYRNGWGYGVFFDSNERRAKLAHRIAYEALIGPFPAGLVSCHQCSNPHCVRPDHIRPGTSKENVADQIRCGRKPIQKGEFNGNAKITRQDVAELRKLRAKGLKLRECAALFGISTSQVSNIALGREWKATPE